ncbi:MAG: DUF3144 domain-containing protein [Arenicella sp.]
MSEVDEDFYQRADAHIMLSNEQMTEDVGSNKVNASFMFSVARFNAWISAAGFDNAAEMMLEKEQIIEFFVEKYKGMLEDNLNDYITHFDQYMKEDNDS